MMPLTVMVVMVESDLMYLKIILADKLSVFLLKPYPQPHQLLSKPIAHQQPMKLAVQPFQQTRLISKYSRTVYSRTVLL